MRPYVLRAYFDTQLLLAESKGKMTHSYRQFFMGHKGDMEARYTVNKGRLTKDMIEDMRESLITADVTVPLGLITGTQQYQLLFRPPESTISTNLENVLRAITAAVLLVLGVLMAPGAIPDSNLTRALIYIAAGLALVLIVRWVNGLRIGAKLIPVVTDTVISSVIWFAAWCFRTVRSKQTS